MKGFRVSYASSLLSKSKPRSETVGPPFGLILGNLVGLGFRVWGLGLRVKGLGLRV